MPRLSISKTRLRRPNRRQRKKLRVGEFQEFIFAVDATFKSAMEAPAYEAFIDAFTGFSHATGFSVGGMGGRLPITRTCAWIQKSGRGSATPEQRDAPASWLLGRPEVASAGAGDLVDGWY
jgi:uncharacterized protein YggL (DUF469 family)